MAEKQAGVTDATIRRDLAFLSSLFSTAIRWEWLDTNPITAVSKRSLKESRPRTRFLTRAEFAALKRAAPDFKPMLLLAVETGMRREELLGLTVRAIDLERREIHLDKTKTNAPRRVPLVDTAVVTVEKPLERPQPTVVALPVLQGRWQPLCGPEGGVRVGPESMRNQRLPLARPSYTFASWWVQGGGDLYRLSRVLGHSTLQMSARYGHLRTDDLHDELRTLAQKRSQERQREAAKPTNARNSALNLLKENGAPGTIRTPDSQIRRR